MQRLTLLELILALSLTVLVLMTIGMAIDMHFQMLDLRRTNVEEAVEIRSIVNIIAKDLIARNPIHPARHDWPGHHERQHRHGGLEPDGGRGQRPQRGGSRGLRADRSGGAGRAEAGAGRDSRSTGKATPTTSRPPPRRRFTLAKCPPRLG